MAQPEMREKILQTASKLFADKGYEAVSMRRVARAVGVTQANLYYYFKNKEDLILCSVASVFSGKTKAFDALMQSTSDPYQQLELGIRWFFSLLREDAVFAKLYSRELLMGDEKRLKFLTEHVFQEPFSFLVHLVDETMVTEDSVLSALFVTSTIVGFFQCGGIIPHLREGQKQYLDAETFTKYFMKLMRKNTKKSLQAASALA